MLTRSPTLWSTSTGLPKLDPREICSKGVQQVEGYCVKCKASREMKDVKYTETKNGRTMAKGTCPVCGTTMNKFLSKEDAAKQKK
jgi:hypothetical protein